MVSPAKAPGVDILFCLETERWATVTLPEAPTGLILWLQQHLGGRPLVNIGVIGAEVVRGLGWAAPMLTNRDPFTGLGNGGNGFTYVLTQRQTNPGATGKWKVLLGPGAGTEKGEDPEWALDLQVWWRHHQLADGPLGSIKGFDVEAAYQQLLQGEGD